MPPNDAIIRAAYNPDLYEVVVVNAIGGGSYLHNAPVTVTAYPDSAERVFDHWEVDGHTPLDISVSPLSFAMPANDVTVTAFYRDVVIPPARYTLTVANGNDLTDAGPYPADTPVTIEADDPPPNQVFDHWESNNGGAFANATAAETIFTMPARAVTVTAIYRNQEAPPPLYDLTVNNGSGSGSYPEGAQVTITADPAPVGKEFDRWEFTGYTPASLTAKDITVIMPANDITAAALYRDIPNSSPDRDNDDDSGDDDSYYQDRPQTRPRHEDHTRYLTEGEIRAAIRLADESGTRLVKTRASYADGHIVIRPELLALMEGYEYIHDTTGSPVQTRVRMKEPHAITQPLYLCGSVTSQAVIRTQALFHTNLPLKALQNPFTCSNAFNGGT
jgi:hypothetical protein